MFLRQPARLQTHLRLVQTDTQSTRRRTGSCVYMCWGSPRQRLLSLGIPNLCKRHEATHQLSLEQNSGTHQSVLCVHQSSHYMIQTIRFGRNCPSPSKTTQWAIRNLANALLQLVIGGAGDSTLLRRCPRGPHPPYHRSPWTTTCHYTSHRARGPRSPSKCPRRR